MKTFKRLRWPVKQAIRPYSVAGMYELSDRFGPGGVCKKDTVMWQKYNKAGEQNRREQASK